jgi:hypothetical protein
MVIDAEMLLDVVDLRERDFPDTAVDKYQAGRNFILILPRHRSHELQSILGLPPECHLNSLDKAGILSLILHLNDADFFALKEAHAEGSDAYFIEHLYLGQLRPTFETFMVYCHIQGIVSRHSTYEGAKLAWVDWMEDLEDRGLTADPTIYSWENNRWHGLRVKPPKQ